MDLSTRIPAAQADQSQRPDDVRSTRQAYRSPQLVGLGNADALMEILGPAQAAYGDMGP